MRQRRPGEVLRWLAVATGAVFLASCRSMTAPVATLAPVAVSARVAADAAPADDGVADSSHDSTIVPVAHTTSDGASIRLQQNMRRCANCCAANCVPR